MVVVVLRLAAGLLFPAREEVFDVVNVRGFGAKESGAAEEDVEVDPGRVNDGWEAAVLIGAAPKVNAGGAPVADEAGAADVCWAGVAPNEND